MNEQAAVERWLYTNLNGCHASTGGRVYAEIIPEGVQLPAILFQRQGGTDLPVFSGERIADFTYIVRVVAETSSTQQLEAAATAIDAALEQATGSEGGVTIGCVREAPFSLTEDVDGVQFRHLGGSYRVRAQKA